MPRVSFLLTRTVFDTLEIRRGWLLMVCSGRNLGPVAMVDAYLEKFVLSHDMIRITVAPSDDLFYFAALMHTRIGQMLVRRDRNGSVIDHLDANQVGALQYPLVNDRLRKVCASAFARAFALREGARLELQRIAERFLACVGLADYRSRLTAEHGLRRFTVYKSAITDRFDSEPFAPRYAAYRDMIRGTEWGTTIGHVADVIKPPGRYKTLYVTDEAFGVRMLSGRQIAQFRPIGLKIMGSGAWKNPADYVLRENTVLVTADGRAEENLADCAVVREDRNGWAASGHVHRLISRTGVHPGLLYLACMSKPVQELMKAFATGSVVDALSAPDVASIPIPYPDNKEGRRLGDKAIDAWSAFAEAALLENSAIAALETELTH
jgi:type I restriction enzyme, S subunit